MIFKDLKRERVREMTDYRIIKCKECGKLFRIKKDIRYPGDPNYCHECNKASERKNVQEYEWR